MDAFVPSGVKMKGYQTPSSDNVSKHVWFINTFADQIWLLNCKLPHRISLDWLIRTEMVLSLLCLGFKLTYVAKCKLQAVGR